jgi:hypothetical protein
LDVAQLLLGLLGLSWWLTSAQASKGKEALFLLHRWLHGVGTCTYPCHTWIRP